MPTVVGEVSEIKDALRSRSETDGVVGAVGHLAWMLFPDGVGRVSVSFNRTPDSVNITVSRA